MSEFKISDAAVEAAFNAWCDVADVDEWRVRNSHEALRAALAAAMPVMFERVGYADSRAHDLMPVKGGCVLSFRNILVRDADDNYNECHYRLKDQPHDN